jgi:glycosyltransferase involved in cell wall biosynthesis
VRPLVSILIPAFNAQEWIVETLQSAIAQTWERKEIIVLDDGSTDRTLMLARRFESDCVRVFTQKNQGAARARNNLFALSKGDYIQWLDADDLLSPEKIAAQMETAQKCSSKRTLFCSAWGRFMYRPSRAKFVSTALWTDLTPAEWLLRKLEQNVYVQTGSWLVSRELCEAAGPWDSSLLGDDDGEYFCRVLLASDGVQFVREGRVFYRMAPDSLSYIGRSDRKMDAQWRSMKMHIRYLRSMEDTPRARMACVTYLQNWLIHFYPGRPDIIEQVHQMAEELGGGLLPPLLSWKYSWVRALFGWGVAKRARMFLPRFRWSLERAWDKFLYQWDRQRSALGGSDTQERDRFPLDYCKAKVTGAGGGLSGQSR